MSDSKIKQLLSRLQEYKGLDDANKKNRFENLLDDLYLALSNSLEKENEITHSINNSKGENDIEHLVLRTIVDTQEKERVRFAKDIHDSIGQQLSGISFHLSSLANQKNISNKQSQVILTKSSEAIKQALGDIRNICFNLTPKTLEYDSLNEAIYELCGNMKLTGVLDFNIEIDDNFPPLNKPLEIAIFRIVQEFITNSTKHGNASKISISLNNDSNFINLNLKDNGVGFEYKTITDYSGLGLKNISTRVKSYSGNLKIIAAPKKGTKFEITIPIAENIKYK